MRVLTLFAFLILAMVTIQAHDSAHNINIGQDDSILIEMKTAAILIDACEEARSDRDHLVNYLKCILCVPPDLNKTRDRLCAHI